MSSESKNGERSISGITPLSKHMCGSKMDIIIANRTNEYGCGTADALNDFSCRSYHAAKFLDLEPLKITIDSNNDKNKNSTKNCTPMVTSQGRNPTEGCEGRAGNYRRNLYYSISQRSTKKKASCIPRFIDDMAYMQTDDEVENLLQFDSSTVPQLQPLTQLFTNAMIINGTNKLISIIIVAEAYARATSDDFHAEASNESVPHIGFIFIGLLNESDGGTTKQKLKTGLHTANSLTTLQ
ncbi:hypothetical protein BDA99DRAFT_533449 [Phascolomyces articulosus]|uniref:Uncharacterized protein n=1 Tax=Phascolomyces articulosus TaxID=60185 RepID=A0AAD5KM19_9FUNG|nr:hypothetical protein BDA99DRAFT_533449 [Phascolomyces articulosus]